MKIKSILGLIIGATLTVAISGSFYLHKVVTRSEVNSKHILVNNKVETKTTQLNQAELQILWNKTHPLIISKVNTSKTFNTRDDKTNTKINTKTIDNTTNESKTDSDKAINKSKTNYNTKVICNTNNNKAVNNSTSVSNKITSSSTKNGSSSLLNNQGNTECSNHREVTTSKSIILKPKQVQSTKENNHGQAVGYATTLPTWHLCSAIVLNPNIQNVMGDESLTESVEPNRLITGKALEIVKGCTSYSQASYKLYNWVTNNISYNWSLEREANATQSYNNECLASYVFNTRSTICYGFASLYSAMLSSVGIPNKVIYGKYQVPDGQWKLHAWNEVYLNGSWISVDPTVGRLQSAYGSTFNYSRYKKIYLLTTAIG